MSTVALYVKSGKPGVPEAIRYVQEFFEHVDVYAGNVGAPLPQPSWADVVLSCLSPWLPPASILSSAQRALNFHPRPAAYPGIGCFNFALYDGVPDYGITCHFMKDTVDSGDIVLVRRFSISPDETVLSLSLKSYDYMLTAFVDIVDGLRHSAFLPYSTDRWERKPYTRNDLNALCMLRPDMEEAEIRCRIKATTYPGKPGASFPRDWLRNTL